MLIYGSNSRLSYTVCDQARENQIAKLAHKIYIASILHSFIWNYVKHINMEGQSHIRVIHAVMNLQGQCVFNIATSQLCCYIIYYTQWWTVDSLIYHIIASMVTICALRKYEDYSCVGLMQHKKYTAREWLLMPKYSWVTPMVHFCALE